MAKVAAKTTNPKTPETLESILAKIQMLEAKVLKLENHVGTLPTPDGYRAVRITKWGHIHPFNETPDTNGDDFASFDEALAYAKAHDAKVKDEVLVILPIYNR